MYGNGMYGTEFGQGQGSGLNYGNARVSKKELASYVCQCLGAREVVYADDFDSDVQRHVCSGGKQIILLNKVLSPVQLPQGIVNVEYFFCRNCGKLILNRLSLEVL